MVLNISVGGALLNALLPIQMLQKIPRIKSLADHENFATAYKHFKFLLDVKRTKLSKKKNSSKQEKLENRKKHYKGSHNIVLSPLYSVTFIEK